MDSARRIHHLRAIVLALAMLGSILAGSPTSSTESLARHVDPTLPPGETTAVVDTHAGGEKSREIDRSALASEATASIFAGGAAVSHRLALAHVEINYCYECGGFA